MSSPEGLWTMRVCVCVPSFGYANRTSPAGTEYSFLSKWISSAITVRLALAGAVGVELDHPPPPRAARARAGPRARRQWRRDIAAADATRHTCRSHDHRYDRLTWQMMAKRSNSGPTRGSWRR